MTEDQAKEALESRFDVSRETFERLEHLVRLLTKWNPRINLVAPGTLPHVWSRHVLDSAQLWPLTPADARIWVDLGSGAGFPGLVIAALAAQHRPAMRVHLIESDARKATFLMTASREAGIPAEIHICRAEQRPPIKADVVSARALAPLDRLLHLSAPFGKPSGICLFPKGENWKSELTQARKNWTFIHEAQPSLTAPGAAILKLKDIRRA